MPVAVSGDDEIGGFIRRHAGHRCRCGQAFQQGSVTRPARERAIVGGGEHFAVVVEKHEPLQRVGVRRPAGEFLSVRQTPQAYAALRSAVARVFESLSKARA